MGTLVLITPGSTEVEIIGEDTSSPSLRKTRRKWRPPTAAERRKHIMAEKKGEGCRWEVFRSERVGNVGPGREYPTAFSPCCKPTSFTARLPERGGETLEYCEEHAALISEHFGAHNVSLRRIESEGKKRPGKKKQK